LWRLRYQSRETDPRPIFLSTETFCPVGGRRPGVGDPGLQVARRLPSPITPVIERRGWHAIGDSSELRHWRAVAALIALADRVHRIALPAVGADPGASARPARVPWLLGRWRGPRNCAIGVHQVLEQLRVPVDCIAGTSIGALIGAGLRDRNERGRNGVDRVGAFRPSAVRGSASAFRSADSPPGSANSATSSGRSLDCGWQLLVAKRPGGRVALETMVRSMILSSDVIASTICRFRFDPCDRPGQRRAGGSFARRAVARAARQLIGTSWR